VTGAIFPSSPFVLAIVPVLVIVLVLVLVLVLDL
jgi:hypothetical protein